MALLTALVRHGAVEVSALMTGLAYYRGVLSQERKFSSRVIELPARVIVLPAAGIVAILAGAAKFDILKSAAVLIGMTGLAAAMGQSFELSNLLTALRPMTLSALLGQMHSCQRERRIGVIESRSRIERILRMAAEAIGAELPLMLILMTRGTGVPAQTEERMIQIFEFDLRLDGSWNLSRDMTGRAFLLLVLANQRKACLREVVEGLAVQTNKRGRLALVFLMTSLAIRLARKAFVIAPVKACPGFYSAFDLDVALQAFELARRRSKFVAGPALDNAFQLLVSA
jgi:hypothetical protein